MNLLKNKEIKKLFLIFLIIIITFTTILTISTKKQIEQNKNNVNNVIANIIGIIKSEYPNINDEEIIHILNSTENLLEGKELLRKYGIEEDSYSVISMKKQAKDIIITNCIILITANLLFVLTFIGYLKHRQIKIEKLTRYIQKLSNKEYSLDIEENSEDELNSLKNELYKITVMLKETADNSVASREALSASVSDISHQLKTPLTSISILLDNLNESENMDNDTQKDFLREISKQIKDMNFLVIALLQLSRLDAGVVEFLQEKVNISNMLYEIKNNLEIMAEVKNVELNIEGKKDVYINGDYNWNKEAIQNIIKNAIEYANKNVIVDISENDVYTKIEITDDGQGIGEKDIKHIFERFYKASNSSENSIGIGLSLAKNIIEKQNGYITVESKLGVGTKFIIKYMKIL